MFAIEITNFGEPDVLKITKRPIPHFKNNEVLIKVKAAGLNRSDILQRKGHYNPPKGITDIPGLEISGTIIDGDLKNSNFSIGDEICALVSGGGYAEYCIAPIDQCLPLPKGIDIIDSAGLPEACFTVWHNLIDKCYLKKHDTVLIHGGSSGIGTLAIQLAKALGCYVYSTVGNEEKEKFIKKLGADVVINYKTHDFFYEISKLNINGINIILDIIAGDYFSKNINLLSYDGRMAIISMVGGRYAEIDINLLLKRRITIIGNTLRFNSNTVKKEISKAVYRNIWPLFEENILKPVTHSYFPLIKANEAHKLMESSKHIGKIILTI